MSHEYVTTLSPIRGSQSLWMPRTCLLVMTFHCTALEPHPVSGVALAFYYSSSQHTEKDISLFVSEHTT